MPEGPSFMPKTKNIPVSEDPTQTPEDGVLAVYTATDPDTGKPAEDVSYAKAYDPDNWFTIDPETAEIKLNKAPDRESPFLVNGTYIAKILAITKDMPGNTATGTIAIHVTDHNDHCPTLTTTHSNLCSNLKTVTVTGFDEDASPYAAPFEFKIVPEGTRGSWDVEVINVIPLLLVFCQCGGANAIFPDQFNDLPFEAKEHLISYHTEGRGEDKEVPLLSVPIMLENQKRVEAARAPSFNGISSNVTKTKTSYNDTMQKIWETNPSLMETDNAYGFAMGSFNQGNVSSSLSRQTFGAHHATGLYDDIALPDAFLNDYYSQKAACAVQVKDVFLEYEFEGQGSSAGSVGCCSLLGSDNDLQFLNDLGSKFKTLAQICSPPIAIPKPSLTHKIASAGMESPTSPVSFTSQEGISMIIDISSTEALQSGSDVTDLVNIVKENEEISTFPQGEAATSISDPITIVDDQIQDITEVNVDRQEATTLKEEVEETGKCVQLSIEGSEDRIGEVGSEPQSSEATEELMDKNLEEDVSLTENTERKQAMANSDSIQAEENMEEMTAFTSDSHEEVMVEQEQVTSDGEKKESILEDGVSQESFSTPNDQDEDIKRQCTEDEDVLEEMASPLQLNISFSEDQDEGSTEEDSCSRSEVEGPLISDDTINVPEEEDKKTAEELTLSIHQSVNITDYQDKDIEGEAVSGCTHLEDQITTGSNIEEEEHIMEEIASAKQSHFRSSNDKDEEIGEVDAGNDIHQVDIQLISDNSIQENKEEDIVEEESPVRQTDFIPEENETGDNSLDIPEREQTDGQALVMGDNMEGLCLVTSSEEMRSSRVATGQVSMLSQDKGTSCGTLASGRVAEDETSQSNYHNPDISLIEPSELGNLILEKGKEEVTFDSEITQGLDNTATNESGQVSPTAYSEIKAAGKTIPSVLEKDPGSSETGAACFIEEAGDLVQNESDGATGDAAWVSLNTVKSADLTEGVSKAPDHTHDAEASGGEMSPVQLQSVISQAPRNKSRKSKKDSNKDPNSPSGKCKQQ
ncbi:Desmoglein-2 [Liparis tanakae]|uniref:Desmoglein-2 n=1 Tax=Liparis tanakae TaxID=230148 RepID=A0A4Z2HTF6_9TELE|nr:Desmoglein-2 [Liparis tanakae]